MFDYLKRKYNEFRYSPDFDIKMQWILMGATVSITCAELAYVKASSVAISRKDLRTMVENNSVMAITDGSHTFVIGPLLESDLENTLARMKEAK